MCIGPIISWLSLTGSRKKHTVQFGLSAMAKLLHNLDLFTPSGTCI